MIFFIIGALVLGAYNQTYDKQTPTTREIYERGLEERK